MPPALAPEMPPGCPWSGWTPPNVDWCEQELCAWVTNPANTWSNAAYIVLGLWMWHLGRRSGRPELVLFGPASIAVGLFSGVYHASYTYFLQFFDFVGMFLFCFLIVTVNALRFGWIETRHKVVFHLGGTALLSALVPVVFQTGFPIQALVFVLILVILGQEWALRSRTRGADYRLFFAALGLITAAGVCSALDVSRVWCDPTNHWVQGHAAWHLLSAASLLALYHFYASLPESPVAGDQGRMV
ncbi:MAG: ceramidase domain-containing protein [Myxococcota bacterium]